MQYDIILVSGEPYVDHPFCGAAIIKRVLDDKGYKVGIIETPDWKKDSDFTKLGKPKLFFGVSAGAMDSMVVNYTPLKKRREDDFEGLEYKIPDRAVTVYCNVLRKLFKQSRLVIAGTESSLRRFSHYDYWENRVRPSILLDSRADILVYGYGEKQVLEIAKRIEAGKELSFIEGTCTIQKEKPSEFCDLPSHEEVKEDKEKFGLAQSMLDVNKCLCQKSGTRYVVQNKAMKYSTNDLDAIYSLPYTRDVSKHPHYKMVQWSVQTHRGCFGGCSFCSINSINGNKVVSRSEKSIVDEITSLAKMNGFNGVVELSGASANMYGMDCVNGKCFKKSCMSCKSVDKSHSKMISLLRKIRSIKGVKKAVVKSGVRFDLAMQSPEYIKEIIKHHIDSTLMIAPEHVDKKVLTLMNKESVSVEEFEKVFYSICKKEGKDYKLSYYLMVGHPGCDLENSKELNKFIKMRKFADFVQVFTPTPMTDSTCDYYTSLHDNKKVHVPYTYKEKKEQKRMALGNK